MQFQHAQDDFLLYLEVEQNYSKNTIVSYDFDLKLYKDFLEKHGRSTDLDDLDPILTRGYIQDLVKNKGLKPRSIHRKISSLKSFSKFCLKNQYMKMDFMAGIVPPKTDDKLPTYMTLDELKQLFRFLEHDIHPLALRNHTMVRLLATTGMRRQEICVT
jgi:site-specific recombinase XerD